MKMITANRLTDGRVIYWAGPGHWTDEIGQGAPLDDDAAEAKLELALADETTEVVGPYLIDVAESHPAGQKHLRESIRLEGPTTGSTKYAHGIKPGAEA